MEKHRPGVMGTFRGHGCPRMGTWNTDKGQLAESDWRSWSTPETFLGLKKMLHVQQLCRSHGLTDH